jgi:hypothetical protein
MIQLLTFQMVSEHMAAFSSRYLPFYYDGMFPPFDEKKDDVDDWPQKLDQIPEGGLDKKHGDEKSEKEGKKPGTTEDQEKKFDKKEESKHLDEKRKFDSLVACAIALQWNDTICNSAPQVLMSHLWQWLIDEQILRTLNHSKKPTARLDRAVALSNRLATKLIRNDELHYAPILATAFTLAEDLLWNDERWAPHATRSFTTSDDNLHIDGTLDWFDPRVKEKQALSTSDS